MFIAPSWAAVAATQQIPALAQMAHRHPRAIRDDWQCLSKPLELVTSAIVGCLTGFAARPAEDGGGTHEQAPDDRGRTGGLDVQSYVLNVIGMWPKGRVRPFAVGGGGAIRARSCVNACASTEAWTDWALSGGGGVQYLLNEMFGLRGEARYFAMTGRHRDPTREGIRFWRVAIGGTFQWVAD